MRAIVPIFLFLCITFQAFPQADPATLEEVYSSAGKLLEDGSYKEALLDYTRLINSGFENDAIWVKRGLAHYYLQEYEQALGDFNEAFKRQVRSSELLGYRALTRYYLNEKGVLTDFEQAFAAGFNNPVAGFVAGNICFQSSEYPKAITYYEQAESWGSDDPVLYNNRGKARYFLQEYARAVTDFNKALLLDPNYPKAYSNRASALHFQGKKKEALEDLRWLENAEGYRFTADEYAMRGMIRLENKEYSEAANDLEQALKRQSELAGVYKSYGLALAFSENHEKAIQMLEVSLEKEGTDVTVLDRLSFLYYDKQQYGTSLKYSQDALAAGSTDPDIQAITGLSMYHREAYQEALPVLSKAAPSTSIDEVHQRLAKLHFDGKNYEAALKALDPLSEKNDPEIHAIRARSLFELGNYEKARASLISWQESDPDHIDAWVLSTRTHMILGDYPSAEKDIARAATIDDNSFDVNALYGEVLLMNKEYQQAAQILEKALASQNDIHAHALLGMAYSRLTQYSKAYMHLKLAGDAGTLSAEGLYDLSFSALEAGKYEDAIRYAEAAHAEGVKGGRIRVVSGLAHYQLGHQEEARKDLMVAVSEGNEELRVLKAMGQLELAGQAYEEAITWFDRVLSQEEDTDSRLGRGQAQAALGEYTAAIQDFSTILTADKDHDKARFGRGAAYFASEKYEEAPADLLLVNNKSLDLPVNEMIALSYARTGNDRALEYLEKSISLQTGNARIFFEAGRLLTDGKEWDKALARLDLALKKGYESPDLFEVRGVARFNVQRYEESLEDLQRSGENKRLIGLDHYQLTQYEQAVTALELVTDRDLEVLVALGDSYFRQGQQAKAGKIFDELIAGGQGNAVVYRHRGMVRAGAGNWEGAIGDYRESLNLEPAHEETIRLLAEAYYQKNNWTEVIALYESRSSVKGIMPFAAMAYYQAGRMNEAKKLLEELVRGGGGSAETEAALGHIYHEEGSHAKAVESLDRALESGPAREEWKAWKALSLFALEKYQDAQPLLDEVLASGYEKEDIFYAAGVSGYENGQEEYAIGRLDKAIALGDSHPDAHYVKGNAFYKLSRFEEAVASYDLAVAGGFEDAILWNNRGKAFSNLENWEEALISYDKAIALDPSYLRALENRGQTHYAMGHFEQAAGDLRQVINLDEEEDGSVRLMLAETYVAMGEDRQAVIFYGEAERRGKGSADLFFSRGACYARIGDLENALSDLNQAYGKGKQDAQLFLERANVQIGLENTRAAMSDLNEAIGREQNHGDAYFNRGYLHELNENYNEAIQDYKKAIELNNEDDVAWYSLANSMVSQGNVGGALQPIEKAISLKEENGTYHKVKGNILYRMERAEDACISWKKAVELGDTKAGYYISQYCD